MTAKARTFIYRDVFQNKTLYYKAILFSVLNKIFDLAPPILIGLAVDTVTQKQNSWLAGIGITSQVEQITWICIATVIIWIFESYFEFLYKVGWRNLAQEVQHSLRLKTYSHLQDLDLGFFEDQNSGNLAAIVNDDINQLERFLNVGANQILQVATTVVVVGSLFVALSPQIAALSFLPAPILLFASIWFQKRLGPRYQKMRGESGQLSSILINNLSGIASIQAYVAQKFELNRIRHQSDKYLKANREAIIFSSAFSPVIRMLVMIGFLVTLYLGGKMTLAGGLAVGSYSMMIFLVQRLLWPLTYLGETIDLFQRAMASTNRVQQLLSKNSQIIDGTKDLNYEKMKPVIKFENVEFSYPTRSNILTNINLEIPPGKTIAFVGPTGSGKSTLLKLLLRFYDVTKGKVTIGATEISEFRLAQLRSQISYISQEAYIFSGTIAQNISFGSFDKGIEEIRLAAQSAEIHSFIAALPDGYDTVIGERGQKLSGGQRQRISMARAILKDAPIFILDEATSAVDNETEASIQRSMKKITGSKTTIIVAHRLSTIREADQIYVLDGGRVIEQGDEPTLLAKQGLYHSLKNIQTGASV
jgi:ATP-binding cassette subfamily B protein